MNEEYAFPIVETMESASVSTGLTKREYFAAMALQGILANEKIKTYDDKLWLAHRAVDMADILIKKLKGE